VAEDMKKFNAIFVRALVLATFGGVWPQLANSASGWTAYGTVEEVYPNPGGNFSARLSVSTNPSSCANREWFSHTGVGNGANRVFAAILSAHATGKPVRVYVTDACDQWGYSDFTSVSVQ
jgi:hypothetical protein